MPTELSPTEVTQARAAVPPPPPPEFTAVVTSRISRVIPAQVAARIDELLIQSGKEVKAGDVVARLNRSELETKLTEAKAAEDAANLSAGAMGAEAAALYQKVVAETRLHNLGASSSMSLRTAQADYAKAGSQAAAEHAKALQAKAAREQCERDLDKTVVTAPIDGVVTNIKTKVGELPTAGTPLARVFDKSHLLVRFAVPREHRGELAIGQRVEMFADGDPRPVYARVSSISRAQEPPIYFTVVEADVDDSKLAANQLTVGGFGKVRIAETRTAEPRGARQ